METDVNWVLSHQIRKGDLANYLLKPLRFNWYRLFAELSWKSHALFYSFIVIGVLTVIYAKVFILQIISVRIPLFIFCAIISYIFNRSFRFIIGTLAFWTKDIGGISSFLNEITSFLSGRWLPLDFFGPLVTVFKLLPFSYAFYFPIQILIDPTLGPADIKRILLLELFWTLLFFLAGLTLWKKGLKHFESVGN